MRQRSEAVVNSRPIDREVPTTPQVPDNLTPAALQATVWHTLKTCYDPEMPVDRVEPELIDACDLPPEQDRRCRVSFKMTLTAPGCSTGEILADEVADRVLALSRRSEINGDRVFDPARDRSQMSEAALLPPGL